jgi:predicted N-acetyltransferase YhbS
MTQTLDIKLLADCPQHINKLAELWYEEIGKPWIPNASVERAKQTYQEHLNSENLPLTFVAIDNNEPIAMVSLRDNDGIRDDLTPWLGSLIVHPHYRGQEIGESLINMTKEQTKKRGYTELYLLTLDPTIHEWYGRLGWHYIAMDKLYHHPVRVMKIDLSI